MSGYKAIWSVRGAKRSHGNSSAAAQIGCALAMTGRSVVAVDADPASIHPLHEYFGIKHPSRTLEDFLWGRVHSLSEAATETGVPGLRMIGGAGRFPRIADPAFPEKRKLINAIRELDADYFVVDLGESASDCALDFFGISAEGIIVIAPEPDSFQNSYNFLKKFVYRRLERLFADNPLVSDIVREATDARSQNSVKSFPDLCERLSSIDRRSAERALSEIKSYNPGLVFNGPGEDSEIAEAFGAAAKTYLGIEVRYAGSVSSRPWADGMRPSISDDMKNEMMEVVRGLLGESLNEPLEPEQDAGVNEPAIGGEAERTDLSEAGRLIAEARALQETFGFNDNIEHMGKVYHVQTEVQGGGNAAVETIIYHGGRIFFAKKTPYGGAEKEPLREFATRQHKAAMAAIKLNRISIEG